ncbi:hypothetical protein ABB37_08712 [Leptomonas pyrrhocoris]|uniref:Uncharacterized protein n=1 Tax=Leptomonas pyrrhocoris TaxID=157538 RepID=A0A0N0DRV7_LEPPY|nr:hypothetical protein ABB37_08712 [Leptomonas pyrrhocoris]KPA75022.1 hypothetical protein ABB37_08712 [Leptomonas pyrrhocoris]|eukprot:XP_015653461.1 hypothetical protein ABB37_08712 [Leptomonas pyrrhocoris]
MNPEEREKQEKTLAKLQWLSERVKPDFKGNPSPFETKKTLRSVEQAKKAKARTLAGDTDFLPFWHGTAPLALDATRSNYITCDAVPPCSRSGAQPPAYGAQAVDPVTGLTEIQLALSWSIPHVPPPETPRTSYEAPAKVTRDASYMRSLTPDERAAAYRQHILEHPKCTLESSRMHNDRWMSSTQLGEPVAKPKRAHRNTALDRQNSVRAVYLMRSS